MKCRGGDGLTGYDKNHIMFRKLSELANNWSGGECAGPHVLGEVNQNKKEEKKTIVQFIFVCFCLEKRYLIMATNTIDNFWITFLHIWEVMDSLFSMKLWRYKINYMNHWMMKCLVALHDLGELRNGYQPKLYYSTYWSSAGNREYRRPPGFTPASLSYRQDRLLCICQCTSGQVELQLQM